ncbi:hypothetical protein ACYOEI_09265 [Singulisphaera rosea]
MKVKADRPPDASSSAPAGIGTKPPVLVHLEHLIPSSPREIYAEQWTTAPKGYSQGGYPRGRAFAGTRTLMEENERQVKEAHALYQDALKQLELDKAELILMKRALTQGVQNSGSSQP